VRSASAVDLDRTAPLFRALRDPDRLRGRCGRCEWRAVCGGSRARAFALTGDPLGEEPTCPHRPGPDPGC
jgi:radical SAM protein with 4Fe4S-binding SPASM domain